MTLDYTFRKRLLHNLKFLRVSVLDLRSVCPNGTTFGNTAICREGRIICRGTVGWRQLGRWLTMPIRRRFDSRSTSSHSRIVVQLTIAITTALTANHALAYFQQKVQCSLWNLWLLQVHYRQWYLALLIRKSLRYRGLSVTFIAISAFINVVFVVVVVVTIKLNCYPRRRRNTAARILRSRCHDVCGCVC